MVLKTKLYPPDPPDFAIHRGRLLESLSQASIACNHVIITAGAGFGKSTLIAQWLVENEIQPAWLSLDKHDNNPHRFLTYITAALSKRYGVNAGSVEVLLKTAGPDEVQPAFETVLELIQSIDERVYIILDDYHLIENQEVIHGTEFLMKHAAKHCSFIFLTRFDPPFSLSQFRLNQQLLELREADLQLSIEETMELLEPVFQKREERFELAEKLRKKTEGWVVGLRLAVLIYSQENSGAQFIERFSGSHTFVADYLMEEVLVHLSPEEEELLLTASLFDRFNTPLLDSILQKQEYSVQKLLDSSPFFLIPLDENRTWFRVHHLVGDLLKKRVPERWSQDRTSEMMTKASVWFEDSGLIDEAVQYAHQSGDRNRLIRLISIHAIKTIATGEIHTVEEWIALLSPEEKLASPDLSVIEGWLATLRQNVQQAAFAAKRAETALSGAQQNYIEDLEGHLALLKANYMVQEPTCSPEQILVLLDSAASLIKKENLLLHGVLELFRGNYYRMTGNLDQAEKSLSKAILFSGQLNDFSLMLPATTSIAELMMLRGKLPVAEALLDETLERVYALFSIIRIPQVAMLHLLLARITMERNELDKVKLHLEKAGIIAEKSSDYNAMIIHAELEGRLHLLMGNVERALNALESAEKLANSTQLHHYKELLIHLKFLIRKELGNRIGLEQCLELTEQHQHGFAFWVGQTELTRIQALAALNRPTLALQEAQQLVEISRAQGSDFVQFQASVWSAALLWQSKKKQNALETLYYVVQTVNENGALRTLLDAGSELPVALKALASSPMVQGDRRAIETIRYLLSNLEDEKNRTPDGLSHPLSDRELEVLRLLAAGLTNKEIGEQLYLAVGTVKKHSYTIYQKLNVKNRIQAVEKSRQLRLI